MQQCVGGEGAEVVVVQQQGVEAGGHPGERGAADGGDVVVTEVEEAEARQGGELVRAQLLQQVVAQHQALQTRAAGQEVCRQPGDIRYSDRTWVVKVHTTTIHYTGQA